MFKRKRLQGSQPIWNVIATQQELLDIRLQLEKCDVIKINFNYGRSPALNRSHLQSPALLQGGAGTPGDSWARLSARGQCTSACGITVPRRTCRAADTHCCFLSRVFYCCLKHGESPLKLHMPDGLSVRGVMSGTPDGFSVTPDSVPSLRM